MAEIRKTYLFIYNVRKNPNYSEIEITSEMIDAGAGEVRDYDPDFVTPQ